mmetsp:Transcript_24591/g.80382  ORF Transcript_24591/g.80382 Transcript_24591/m.80382 type:complete len:310 (+) Transcript_24591:2629-3558(+)
MGTVLAWRCHFYGETRRKQNAGAEEEEEDAAVAAEDERSILTEILYGTAGFFSCTLSHSAGDGVHIYKGDALLLDTIVANCAGAGVTIAGELCRVELQKCAVRSCKLVGVEACHGARASLLHTKVEDIPNGPGLLAALSGRVDATEVAVERCGRSSVEAAGLRASVSLTRCTLARGLEAGVLARDKALADLAGVRVDAHRLASVFVQGGALATLRDCTLVDGDAEGVLAHGRGSRAELRDSSVLNHANAGVLCADDAAVLLAGGNRVANNARGCVELVGSGACARGDRGGNSFGCRFDGCVQCLPRTSV